MEVWYACRILLVYSERNPREWLQKKKIKKDILKLSTCTASCIESVKILCIRSYGEWPKDLTEVTMIALKKKSQATKCSEHRTISLIVHTAKIVTKILRRRIEGKLRMYSEKISLDLEEEKELRMQVG